MTGTCPLRRPFNLGCRAVYSLSRWCDYASNVLSRREAHIGENPQRRKHADTPVYVALRARRLSGGTGAFGRS